MQCQPGKCLKDQLFVCVVPYPKSAMQRTTVQWDEKYELCVPAVQKVVFMHCMHFNLKHKVPLNSWFAVILSNQENGNLQY